ncbi:MAG: sigma factor-like helix-turn-helix DNA-binding protein [Sphingomonas sp.]|jgi:hypothetical protein|uniref:sigma factor-like helix-turn-helix DNA-binding protein n=1 Tax=Sphingomonas sp. TaxID=28214 RepID=UPI003567D53A
MLRSAVDEWDIEVFHSLEEVLRAWEQQREERKTAVLHVGFERRVAKSFEQLASQFPGRVLLTPSAKGALPSSFATSKGAVGNVESEPIFLALEGWGYAEREPSPPCAAPAVNMAGWVRLFVLDHPQQVGPLASIGIIDDDTYLDFENSLEPELRTQLAICRSAYLVGDQGDDPTMLARAAPPWLSSLVLSELDLTVRIGNVIRDRSLSRVSDIGALTVAEMLRFPNFGRTSIHQLADILRRALLDGPRGGEDEVSRSSAGNLLEAVRLSLATCADRERDILVRRMGLGCPNETLAEIGESYGITRERIRQIEAKVVDRLIRREVWDDLLAAKLHVLLADREFPLPLIGAEALDPWFSGVAAHRDAVRYLIANMCNAAVSLVEIDGVEYLSFLSQDSWHEIVATARRLLASGVDQRWTEQDCQHHVKLLIPDDAREFGALLWEISAKWCHFADDAEARTLISYGRGVDQVVEAVLLESDTPLHYSDITIQATARAGRDLDERRVHNAAAEVGYLFGPGTYGMLKHVTASRAIWEALADEAAEIVMEATVDRQWHASELIDLLIGRGVTLPDHFDKYQMDIALKQVAQLHSLGRMVWTKCEAANENVRVDIRQAVIAIMQNAGEPLSSTELRQRLVAVRGINQGMQFQVIDPLIKLSSQVWALNDRDLSIKRPDQPAFLDSIVTQLRSRQRPVHISECAEILGDIVPARAVFCLAGLDPRLQVTQDRFLTLVEWKSAVQDGKRQANAAA